MKTLDLISYAPIISDKEIGNEIYEKIKALLSSGEIVEIDLSQIKSMATFCAKQIFGKLYIDLGSEKFFERVVLKNANNDIKSIVRIGIQHSISENK